MYKLSRQQSNMPDSKSLCQKLQNVKTKTSFLALLSNWAIFSCNKRKYICFINILKFRKSWMKFKYILVGVTLRKINIHLSIVIIDKLNVKFQVMQRLYFCSILKDFPPVTNGLLALAQLLKFKKFASLSKIIAS